MSYEWASTLLMPGTVPLHSINENGVDLTSPIFLDLNSDFIASPIDYGDGTLYQYPQYLDEHVNRSWRFRGFAKVEISGAVQIDWEYDDLSGDGSYGPFSFSFERTIAAPAGISWGTWSQFEDQPRPVRAGMGSIKGALASNIYTRADELGGSLTWELPIPQSGIEDAESVSNASPWTLEIYANAYGNCGLARHRESPTQQWSYPVLFSTTIFALLTTPDFNGDDVTMTAEARSIDPGIGTSPDYPQIPGTVELDASYFPGVKDMWNFPATAVYDEPVTEKQIGASAYFTSITVTFSEPFEFTQPSALIS